MAQFLDGWMPDHSLEFKHVRPVLSEECVGRVSSLCKTRRVGRHGPALPVLGKDRLRVSRLFLVTRIS